MNKPEISVVMGVYNSESHLDDTLQSILSQTDVELEFIIVNDGSEDRSEQLIRAHMRDDARIKLINQTNQGLTRALIEGCKQAQGDYIARQDAGDISLPGRLKTQVNQLRVNSTSAMCSTGCIFIAPDGEEFGRIIQPAEEAANGLKQRSLKTIKGPPHHGCMMFRRDTYERVGGYRREFQVAQDLDLWTRMIEYGSHTSIPHVLYKAIAHKSSISSLKRDQQIETAKVIFECCEARASGKSDIAILQQLEKVNSTPSGASISSSKSDSDFYYFVGASLQATDPKAGAKYLKRALQANRLNWKALIKLLRI